MINTKNQKIKYVNIKKNIPMQSKMKLVLTLS